MLYVRRYSIATRKPVLVPAGILIWCWFPAVLGSGECKSISSLQILYFSTVFCRMPQFCRCTCAYIKQLARLAVVLLLRNTPRTGRLIDLQGTPGSVGKLCMPLNCTGFRQVPAGNATPQQALQRSCTARTFRLARGCLQPGVRCTICRTPVSSERNNSHEFWCLFRCVVQP